MEPPKFLQKNQAFLQQDTPPRHSPAQPAPPPQKAFLHQNIPFLQQYAPPRLSPAPPAPPLQRAKYALVLEDTPDRVEQLAANADSEVFVHPASTQTSKTTSAPTRPLGLLAAGHGPSTFWQSEPFDFLAVGALRRSGRRCPSTFWQSAPFGFRMAGNLSAARPTVDSSQSAVLSSGHDPAAERRGVTVDELETAKSAAANSGPESGPSSRTHCRLPRGKKWKRLQLQQHSCVDNVPAAVWRAIVPLADLRDNL